MRKSIAFSSLLPALVNALPLNSTSGVEDGLQWEPCDLPFPNSTQANIAVPIDCATLAVPLDYTQPRSDTLQLQLVRAKAANGQARGSVVFAPGGPGVSGVEEVAKFGHVYGRILGGEYDIIGFDPRGVGRTIPFVCVAEGAQNDTESSHKTKRHPYINSTVSIPMVDSWSLLKSKAWEDGGAFSQTCFEAQKETGRFLSTTSVARDLLQIVDALQEDGKLRMWGRSYGTILGQTFAAMFPDRIHRLLLDSVVLPEDYFSGQWVSSTREADESLAHFLQDCVDVGPNVCPIANFTGPNSTGQTLMQAFASSLQEVRDNNILLPETYPLSPPWWQRDGRIPLFLELKSQIFAQLYKPLDYPLALGTVNTTLQKAFETLTNLTNDDIPPPTELPWSLGANAFHGVACLDSPFRADAIEDMYASIQAQELGGGMFADSFGVQTWPCAQWKFEPPERYTGGYRGINTSHPVLFVNGAFDPITPLSAAFQAAAGFPGARMVSHLGHGHGLANHPSLCVLRTIRTYFLNGTLPDPDLVCDPDLSAWDFVLQVTAGNGTVEVGEEGGSEEERGMMEMVYSLAWESSGLPALTNGVGVGV